jgi:hypothetical protein
MKCFSIIDIQSHEMSAPESVLGNANSKVVCDFLSTALVEAAQARVLRNIAARGL